MVSGVALILALTAVQSEDRMRIRRDSWDPAWGPCHGSHRPHDQMGDFPHQVRGPKRDRRHRGAWKLEVGPRDRWLARM